MNLYSNYFAMKYREILIIVKQRTEIFFSCRKVTAKLKITCPHVDDEFYLPSVQVERVQLY